MTKRLFTQFFLLLFIVSSCGDNEGEFFNLNAAASVRVNPNIGCIFNEEINHAELFLADGTADGGQFLYFSTSRTAFFSLEFLLRDSIPLLTNRGLGWLERSDNLMPSPENIRFIGDANNFLVLSFVELPNPGSSVGEYFFFTSNQSLFDTGERYSTPFDSVTDIHLFNYEDNFALNNSDSGLVVHHFRQDDFTFKSTFEWFDRGKLSFLSAETGIALLNSSNNSPESPYENGRLYISQTADSASTWSEPMPTNLSVEVERIDRTSEDTYFITTTDRQFYYSEGGEEWMELPVGAEEGFVLVGTPNQWAKVSPTNPGSDSVSYNFELFTVNFEDGSNFSVGPSPLPLFSDVRTSPPITAPKISFYGRNTDRMIVYNNQQMRFSFNQGVSWQELIERYPYHEEDATRECR